MDPSLSPETGESTAPSQSERLSIWVALLVFGSIVMGASVEVKNDQFWPNSEAKWAVACSVLTVIFAGIISAAHLHGLARALLIGTPVEGILAFLLALFWGCTVAVVNESDEDLFFNESNQTSAVKNANLYYFSWAAFVTAVILLVNYVRATYGLDVVAHARDSRLSRWAALFVTSLIVMGASSRILNTNCPISDLTIYGGNTVESKENLRIYESYCPRTKFGVAVGVLGVLTAAFVIAGKVRYSLLTITVEFRLSLLMSILFGFGVAYVTSNEGPGAFIGNLYYFIWMSLLLSTALLVESFRATQEVPSADMAEEGDSGAVELPIDPLDENI